MKEFQVIFKPKKGGVVTLRTGVSAESAEQAGEKILASYPKGEVLEVRDPDVAVQIARDLIGALMHEVEKRAIVAGWRSHG